jgi:chromosome segregation protein
VRRCCSATANPPTTSTARTSGRRDITDVFLGTGLGPRAYAIIEQGMISRVIEAKPDELRVFLEEAAGISRYKERRKETEHRSPTRARTWRASTTSATSWARRSRSWKARQSRVALQGAAAGPAAQAAPAVVPAAQGRGGRPREARARHRRVSNEVEAGTAQLREVESRVETARVAHYGAGDALNAAQAAVYAANAEWRRMNRSCATSKKAAAGWKASTPNAGAARSWREQRAQLTQALHMWAARSGGAKQRVAEAQARLCRGKHAPARSRQAYRAAQEQLNESRSKLLQAENRLLLEQQNGAHLEGSLQSLASAANGWRRAAGAGRAGCGGMNAANERVLQLDREIGACAVALDALQAEAESLAAASAAAADAKARRAGNTPRRTPSWRR